MLSAFLLAALLASTSAERESLLVLENHNVRVEVRHAIDGWHETYSARAGHQWHMVLSSGRRGGPEPSLVRDGTQWDRTFARAEARSSPRGERSIVLSAEDGGTRLVKQIALCGTEPMLHVQVSCSLTVSCRISDIRSSYSFMPEGATDGPGCFPDFVFTPQLRPEQTDVIGDHVFRSPALMLQRGGIFAALIPDVGLINVSGRRIQSAADAHVDSSAPPMLSYGLLPWVRRGHVYYQHTDSMSVQLRDTTVRYGYFLMLRADAPQRSGYRDVVRFMWDSLGSLSLRCPVGPQSDRFDVYARRAWYEYLPHVALDTTFSGVQVTLLRQARLAWSNKLPPAADNDAWFNVWFNSLRTAYGMSLYGSNNNDPHLVAQAERVLNLALAAPAGRGLAPSIFYLDSLGGHWVADHAWGGIRNGECYSMFHNAWTCYWLLQWAEIVPARSQEILGFARTVGDFLVAHQLGSGVIPSWYDPASFDAVPELREDNAETAGAALFLAELTRKTGDARYLQSAIRAMAYIFREVLPRERWFDFETFYSCARKPLGFYDHNTHQYPQNTLSMHQAAEACLVLFELTGESLYRQHGEEVLDYLCLYQQVWSPRWLSCQLFGGFGVQNTDGEWSDSRQAYFAITLMRYYKLTGRREYLERAVAAARAQFSLFEPPPSPRTAENYAHSALDRLAGVTGLHWGTGSAVVSAELLTQEYGDAFVDVAGKWGVGIDGCTCDEVRIDSTTMQVHLRDDVHSPRKLRLVCGNITGAQYSLFVNNTNYGTLPAADLRKGLLVSIQ
jgi:hypothetical protein